MTSRQYKRALLVLAVSGLVALMALAVMLDLHWNSGQGLGSIVVLGITALVVVWYAGETRRLALSTKRMADAGIFPNVVIRAEDRFDEPSWRQATFDAALKCYVPVYYDIMHGKAAESDKRQQEELLREAREEVARREPREDYVRRVFVIRNHGPGPALDVCVDTSDGGLEEVARVLLPQVVVQLPGTDSRREATLRYRDVSGCEYTHKWRYDDSLADWCPV